MRIISVLCLGAGFTGASIDSPTTIFEALYGGSSLRLTDAEKAQHLKSFQSALKESTSNLEWRNIFERTRPAVTKSVIDAISRTSDRMWEPVLEGYRFEGAPLSIAKRQCGTFLNSPRKAALPVVSHAGDDTPIPDSFDSRRDFGPECSGLIGTARDQSNCGSCWSFSTTTALEDRLCLTHQGHAHPLLSPLDTLSCCNEEAGCNSFGCDGGDPASAWEWFVSNGVVSGGDYGDQSTCKPYGFPSCAHHVTVPDLKPCSGDSEYSTPQCEAKCSNNEFSTPYTSDKHKAVTAYSVEPSERSIKLEIMKNGPVSAAFMVYEDFLAYKSGIYHHVTGEAVGGHAVKLIGWGEEKGVKYWLLLNSWNPSWGENGAFRMKLHECGIMEEITAGRIQEETDINMNVSIETV